MASGSRGPRRRLAYVGRSSSGDGRGSSSSRSSGSGSRSVTVLPGLEAEGRVLDVADAEDEEEQEERAEEKIKDAVPDHFRGGRDHVRALRASPCDRVEKRQEDDDTSAADVARAHAITSVKGRAGKAKDSSPT